MLNVIIALVILIASCIPLVILCRLLWHIGTWFKVRNQDFYNWSQSNQKEQE